MWNKFLKILYIDNVFNTLQVNPVKDASTETLDDALYRTMESTLNITSPSTDAAMANSKSGNCTVQDMLFCK